MLLHHREAMHTQQVHRAVLWHFFDILVKCCLDMGVNYKN